MPNFTILFSDYLKNYEVPSSLDLMPDDVNGKTFKQRFIERNYYKEIGSETEELFSMHLAIRCDECVEDYKWRIELFNEHYTKLMERYISVHNEYTTQNEGTDTTENTGKHYYNPLDVTSETLSDTDKGESNLIYGRKITEKNDQQRAVSWARSNPEIMKAALELEDIYSKALASLDTLFMVIL